MVKAIVALSLSRDGNFCLIIRVCTVCTGLASQSFHLPVAVALQVLRTTTSNATDDCQALSESAASHPRISQAVDTKKFNNEFCRILLEKEQPMPDDSLLRDDHFGETMNMVQDRNEAMITEMISQQTFPNVQVMAIREVKLILSKR